MAFAVKTGFEAIQQILRMPHLTCAATSERPKVMMLEFGIHASVRDALPVDRWPIPL